MKLTKEKIVNEAIALLNEEGLQKVTLRNLADRLSIKAPSLFWHIRNKEELLALIDEALFSQCLNRIPACKTFQHWLYEFGMSLWRAQCDAPDIPKLIERANLSNEAIENLYQILLDEISGFEVDLKLATKIQGSVQALVTGWTILSNKSKQADYSPETDFSPLTEDFEQSLKALIQGWETELTKN